MERLRIRLNQLATWCYPNTCLLCGNPSEQAIDICACCQQHLPYNQTACPQCAYPSTTDSLCHTCQRTPPPFKTSHATFHYDFPIANLLINLKFNHQLVVARLLGELMALNLQQHGIPMPECIIPIPLHAKRLRQRGYNQSLELAKPIAKQLNLAIDHHTCQRTRPTIAQSELDATARKSNVKQAFTLKRPLPYTHVAIIDDIMTTGYTAAEFSQTLQQSGINTVQVWTCARAHL